jgi:hypothetical protein
MKRHIGPLTSLLLASASFACFAPRAETFTERADTRTLLMETFASYASIDEVRALFPTDTPLRVVEEDGRSESDSRPPFRIHRVSVDGYTHHGCRGELTLKFFNDRLSSVWFYPDEPRKYVEVLAADGLDVASADAARIPPHTRISGGRDFRDREYVRWEDTRLVEQEDRWISRYA